MIRTMDGFHQDDEGDWVAELSCLHLQHVRHEPPFRDRPWIETASGRRSRVGSELECPLCDRAEMPDGLQIVRTAGPFDSETLPAGLRREHRVAAGTWGLLRVIEGTVELAMATDPPISQLLRTGAAQAIPPGVPHELHVDGPFRVSVDFLTRGESSSRGGGGLNDSV